MHGAPRTPSWTELSATADVGDTTLTLLEAVNWKLGDEIGIASTDFDHK